MFPFHVEGSEPPGIYPVTRVYFYFMSIWGTNCPTPCPEDTKVSLLPSDASTERDPAVWDLTISGIVLFHTQELHDTFLAGSMFSKVLGNIVSVDILEKAT